MQGSTIEVSVYDTVINKTPLCYRTNRIVGGVAPSEYLARLESGYKKGDPPIEATDLDGHLRSHCIPVEALRADDFDAFMAQRRQALLRLIEKATGHTIIQTAASADEGEEPSDAIARDSEFAAVPA